ncbi:hypothetical protein P7C70_g6352, partial [Phenoliferia sp. Uapishka_3]
MMPQRTSARRTSQPQGTLSRDLQILADDDELNSQQALESAYSVPRSAFGPAEASTTLTFSTAPAPSSSPAPGGAPPTFSSSSTPAEISGDDECGGNEDVEMMEGGGIRQGDGTLTPLATQDMNPEFLSNHPVAFRERMMRGRTFGREVQATYADPPPSGSKQLPSEGGGSDMQEALDLSGSADDGGWLGSFSQLESVESQWATLKEGHSEAAASKVSVQDPYLIGTDNIYSYMGTQTEMFSRALGSQDVNNMGRALVGLERSVAVLAAPSEEQRRKNNAKDSEINKNTVICGCNAYCKPAGLLRVHPRVRTKHLNWIHEATDSESSDTDSSHEDLVFNRAGASTRNFTAPSPPLLPQHSPRSPSAVFEENEFGGGTPDLEEVFGQLGLDPKASDSESSSESGSSGSEGDDEAPFFFEAVDENEDQRVWDEEELRDAAFERLGPAGFARMEALIEQAALRPDDIKMVKVASFRAAASLTRGQYEVFLHWFSELGAESEYILKKRIKALAQLDVEEIPCCRDVHMAFTGALANLSHCPVCNQPKNDLNGKPVATYIYIPVAQTLTAAYLDTDYAKASSYRRDYKYDPTHLHDVFDGENYFVGQQTKVVVDGVEQEHQFWDGDADVALGIFLDGFQLYKSGAHDCWPVIGVDYCLPPTLRYLTKNVIPILLIRGPKKPQNFDTFLTPFIRDAKLSALEGHMIYDAHLDMEIVQRFYVLLYGGDMPAISMLMRMKGHAGKYPCRCCRIFGVWFAKHYYYVLIPPDYTLPNSPPPPANISPHYDALNLPLRTDETYFADVATVDAAGNKADASRDCGVNGLARVASVPGTSMVRSFPFDLMHLLLENLVKVRLASIGVSVQKADFKVIQNLISIWRGTFKGYTGAWVMDDVTWEEIDTIILNSSRTTPSSFGRRMPAPGAHQGWFTAEDYSNFLLYLGPIVLHSRLPPTYFAHFMELRSIAIRLLDLQISRASIAVGGSLRLDLAKWVQDYELIYFQRKAENLKFCTYVLHAVLHLADNMTWCGPLHLYWSFIMERYCQMLGNLVTSKLHPYKSLSNNLETQQRLKSISNRFAAVRTALQLPPKKPKYTFLEREFFKLASPHTTLRLAGSLRSNLIGYFSAARCAPGLVPSASQRKTTEKHLPTHASSWAQIQFDDNRDHIDAADGNSSSLRLHWRRDSSWLIYDTMVDVNAHRRHGAVRLERQVAYAQLERLLVVKYRDVDYTLAVIRPAKASSVNLNAAREIIRYQTGAVGLGGSEIINCLLIRGSIARAEDGGWWYIADRSEEGARPLFRDEEPIIEGNESD